MNQMSVELRADLYAPDLLTGFGSRAALIARLAVAVERESPPSVVAVFGLDGLDEFEKAYGSFGADDVIARMAAEFARIVRPEGVCYAPRRREFCALFAVPFAAASPILAAAAIALRREGRSRRSRPRSASRCCPSRRTTPIGALIVADRNLNQARRAQLRKRTGSRQE